MDRAEHEKCESSRSLVHSLAYVPLTEELYESIFRDDSFASSHLGPNEFVGSGHSLVFHEACHELIQFWTLLVPVFGGENEKEFLGLLPHFIHHRRFLLFGSTDLEMTCC